MDRNTSKTGKADRDLSWFKSHDQVTKKPKLKDLYQHVTPQYVLKWKVIGTLLGVASEKLDIIEHDNRDKAEPCCNEMLKWWLCVDPTASWGKLFTVIESPAVSCSQEGADAVSILSEMIRDINVRERFKTDEEPWPPDQPKNFIPLVLIHHKGKHTIKETTEMAQIIQTHDIDEITSLASNQSATKHHPKLDSHEPLERAPLNCSKVTEELTEILASLEQSKGPQFVLIEGAPGIGKSILLKEIAYRWGKKQLLRMFKLVLLVPLRDPTVQQVVSVSDLLQHFCVDNRRAAQIATACHDYLSENGGKDLLFLFDGFDEFPTELQKSSLITKILNRKVLPLCALVVSSRPHATAYLRITSTFRIDILGFSEVQRNKFIEQALEKQVQIKQLNQYLEDHITISSLCVVPFNMVVLVYLYKLGGSLPKNSTELYNHFICQTIHRHLATKDQHPLDNTITDLSSLPDPCNKIIKQLSKFSLWALNNNMLVFTFDEIKGACPDITSIPQAIDGFGLLKAVQHYDINGKGKTYTFNFLHFTIQEFLAAHHVANNLSPNDELKILEEKFFQSDYYSNMFAMYITLTKGQTPSFKQFIRPSLVQRLIGYLTGAQVANRFLDDQVKCFRLFKCFLKLTTKMSADPLKMQQYLISNVS